MDNWFVTSLLKAEKADSCGQGGGGGVSQMWMFTWEKNDIHFFY